MSKYFYKGMLDTSNSLVIYQYMKDSVLKQCQSDLNIIQGYKDTTNIIIKNLKLQKRLTPPDDAIIYPLCNLHVNMIELVLKIILRWLVYHKTFDKCMFLTKISTEEKKQINKVLTSHDLSTLLNCIINILDTSKNPHSIKSLKKLDKIVREFDHYEINSSSVRYHTDIKNKPYKLYQQQINCRIYDMHFDICEIIAEIEFYPELEHFTLCTNGCFSKNYITELNYMLEVCKKGSSLFSKEKSFISEIKKLTHNERAIIVNALYMVKQGIGSTSSLPYFIRWDDDLINEKLYEYRDLHQHIFDRINHFIQYAKEFL